MGLSNFNAYYFDSVGFTTALAKGLGIDNDQLDILSSNMNTGLLQASIKPKEGAVFPSEELASIQSKLDDPASITMPAKYGEVTSIDYSSTQTASFPPRKSLQAMYFYHSLSSHEPKQQPAISSVTSIRAERL